MSRLYSRRKGKAGSKKPLKKTKTVWVRYKPKEIELLIAKLAKEEKTCSQIGLILRDVYGVPSVKSILGKTILTVLKEKNLEEKIPEDLMALIRKVVQVRKHLQTNKKDQTAVRGLQLSESKIKRLVKYYKQTGRLPLDWKYDTESLKLYVG